MPTNIRSSVAVKAKMATASVRMERVFWGTGA